MPTCKNCQQPAAVPHIFCDKCLNSWLIMRKYVQTELFKKYGEPTRQTNPIIIKEMKLSENIWKKNRLEFEKQITNYI